MLSLGADEPPRAVSQSVSHTRLVPISGQPGRFGAVAEVRQTIAPITFGLPGMDDKFTIEVAGEWVMRAAADGTKGSVTFGSQNRNDDDRPALRLIHGKQVVDEVGLRDAGREGIFVDGQPVGDIRIGGDKRAVAGRPAGGAGPASGDAAAAGQHGGVAQRRRRGRCREGARGLSRRARQPALHRGGGG